MKKLLLASVGMLALGAASASAADIARRPLPAKAPVYVTPAYNWTGLYVCINGGYGFGRSSFNNTLGTQGFDVNGGLVGGTIGYNYQVGQVVFGLEGDVDWSDIRGSSPATGVCAGGTCSFRNDWLGTVRGRLGYAFDRFMPYVTGGVAFGNLKTLAPGFSGQDTTNAGWTAGGGLEFAINGPWTAKIEYLYVDLGNDTCGVPNCGVSTNTDFHTNIVRAGLNYRF
jgi:outer membrane immunogenic protein